MASSALVGGGDYLTRFAIESLKLLAAIACGVLLVFLAIWGVSYVLITLVGTTILVFGYAVNSTRELWHSRWYWCVLATLLAAHCVVVLGLIRVGVTHFGTVFIVPCGTLELLGMLLLLDRVEKRRRRSRSRRL